MLKSINFFILLILSQLVPSGHSNFVQDMRLFNKFWENIKKFNYTKKDDNFNDGNIGNYQRSLMSDSFFDESATFESSSPVSFDMLFNINPKVQTIITSQFEDTHQMECDEIDYYYNHFQNKCLKNPCGVGYEPNELNICEKQLEEYISSHINQLLLNMTIYVNCDHINSISVAMANNSYGLMESKIINYIHQIFEITNSSEENIKIEGFVNQDQTHVHEECIINATVSVSLKHLLPAGVQWSMNSIQVVPIEKNDLIFSMIFTSIEIDGGEEDWCTSDDQLITLWNYENLTFSTDYSFNVAYNPVSEGYEVAFYLNYTDRFYYHEDRRIIFAIDFPDNDTEQSTKSNETRILQAVQLCHRQPRIRRNCSEELFRIHLQSCEYQVLHNGSLIYYKIQQPISLFDYEYILPKHKKLPSIQIKEFITKTWQLDELKAEIDKNFMEITDNFNAIICIKPSVSQMHYELTDGLRNFTIKQENTNAAYIQKTYLTKEEIIHYLSLTLNISDIEEQTYNFSVQQHLLLWKRLKRFNLFDRIIGYFSVTMLSISTLAITISFIIYLTYKELTDHFMGWNLMHLMVSYLFAMLSFLSSSFRTSQLLCTIAALLTHYSLLATFFWMNVIAFDFWSNFRGISLARLIRYIDDDKLRKHLYRLYALGLPLVIVCVAITFDLIKSTNISEWRPCYLGNNIHCPNDIADCTEQKCWIRQPKATIVFFIVPVCIVLFINFSLLFASIYNIKRRKKNVATFVYGKSSMTDLQHFASTGKLRRCSINSLPTHQDLKLFIRMSIVLGSTWTIGFLNDIVYAYVYKIVLRFVFVSLNASLGIIIFAVFICMNSKVRRLLYTTYQNHFTNNTRLCSLSTIHSINNIIPPNDGEVDSRKRPSHPSLNDKLTNKLDIFSNLSYVVGSDNSSMEFSVKNSYSINNRQKKEKKK
ncbi:hypothetical protein SNEBB_010978 [Seison nebaliae]|nr:hypothetical protein SNEBB_010978 [Seison nebaliae]